jgi:hypothetical protein
LRLGESAFEANCCTDANRVRSLSDFADAAQQLKATACRKTRRSSSQSKSKNVTLLAMATNLVLCGVAVGFLRLTLELAALERTMMAALASGILLVSARRGV